MDAPVFMNRELSWLKFNKRVLEEAERTDVPLCERMNFLSIYQSNLDEFFMVRVGTLTDQRELNPSMTDNKTNMTAEEQIRAILKEVQILNTQKEAVYANVLDELKEQHVRIVDFKKIDEEESKRLKQYFDVEIAPLLSPMIVGARQPFPFMKNKEIYAAAVLEKSQGKDQIGLIPCSSDVFPRLIPVSNSQSDEHLYILSEELILHFLPSVFDDYKVLGKSLIRVTRNADIDSDALYDEDLDYREFMADLMKKRRRLQPIRLELSRELDEKVIRAFCNEFQIEEDSVFRNNTPLDLSFFGEIRDLLRQKSDLFYTKKPVRKSEQFLPGMKILPQIKDKDKLLAYPFDSMKTFISMLEEAANDPQVISIKITLYRVAKQSKIIEALIDAAQNGKDVFALCELKARFDEENNIAMSRRLEEAGVTVVYGVTGYKVHSKLCLITKIVDGQPEYYTQIGTGNYNENTARFYTDFCLMTSNRAIAQDAIQVFQAIAMDETVHETKSLLVAPNCLQNKVIAMIDDEITKASAGQNAYIGIKINSLTDKKIIDELIRASQAGVKIDMVVRGICCLIPGVAGYTDNIRVISIVGRLLEHSRIYIFGAGEEKKVYISSADFMTRNTLRRVEVGAPVLDSDLKKQILWMFDKMIHDNCQAKKLGSDGNYSKVSGGDKKINSQEIFYTMPDFAPVQAMSKQSAAPANREAAAASDKRITNLNSNRRRKPANPVADFFENLFKRNR